MISEVNTDPAFRQKMLDGGFAMLDSDANDVAAFMSAETDEYLQDAREAGLITYSSKSNPGRTRRWRSATFCRR